MREITLSKLQNGESVDPKKMKLEIPIDLDTKEAKPQQNKIQNYKVVQNMMNSNVSI